MRSQNWGWLSERSERSERAKRSEPEALKLHTRQALKLHTRQARKLHTRQATGGSDMKLQVGQRSRQGLQWDQPQDPPTPPPFLILASYRSPWDEIPPVARGISPGYVPHQYYQAYVARESGTGYATRDRQNVASIPSELM